MGWIKAAKATDGETVRGIIIAGLPDDKIKYALSMTRTSRFIRMNSPVSSRGRASPEQIRAESKLQANPSYCGQVLSP